MARSSCRTAQVLIVKRKYDPLAGQWSLPGGGVELGETLEESVAREMLEETGLQVEVGPVDRGLRSHHPRRAAARCSITSCWSTICAGRVGGELQAGSDVADARFVDPAELPEYNLTVKANEVIARALELDRQAPRAVR